MRTLFCRALLLAGLAAALPTVAGAYPITVTISTVASGSLGSTSFSDQLVTVQAFFTTELTGCLVCTYEDGFSAVYTFNGLQASVTVAGLGTYEEQANVLASVSPGFLSVYDVEGRLGLNVESPAITATNFFTPSFGPITGSTIQPDSCLPFACPPHMFTTAGDLVLTSVADTATGEVQADSTVPEPGTLGMIVTGLLGVSGFLRRGR
jgi:hypothetical protein